jgi:hypothetical protein
MNDLCECVNWPREINPNYLTNHHPDCKHYNDSLIDAYKVITNNTFYYTEDENQVIDTIKDKTDSLIRIVKEKMHREVFENLPEFEGF